MPTLVVEVEYQILELLKMEPVQYGIYPVREEIVEEDILLLKVVQSPWAKYPSAPELAWGKYS